MSHWFDMKHIFGREEGGEKGKEECKGKQGGRKVSKELGLPNILD